MRRAATCGGADGLPDRLAGGLDLRGFRASEGDAKRVRREFHWHGAVIPREAELGFDEAWIYSIGEYSA